MMAGAKPRAILVAGVMSGTSADGVDVALVRVSPGAETPRLKVLGHRSFPYPKAVRAAVLAAMDAPEISVAELSRLHWLLGEIYAEAIAATCAELGAKPTLIGLHGQTIYHQATAAKYLGKPVRATWQIGEAAVVSERLRMPVVSDFRPNDLAAGGQGAPLVPMLDFCLFRSRTRNRVLLNLGGIANVTAIPAGSELGGLLAFDTGPANMIVDALMNECFSKPYDRGGKVAASGVVLPELVAACLCEPWFSAAPPKSCGREQFGAAFVERFRQRARGASDADVIASAAELTAASVLDAYGRFVWAHLGQRAPLAKATEVIVSGGGVRNAWLLSRLREGFAALGVGVKAVDELGVDAQAKEAVAFALLAWQRWHGLPGNVPSATGAARAAVLGKVTLP